MYLPKRKHLASNAFHNFICFNKLVLLFVHSQDNYTFAQPGIQRKVKALEELVSRIDGKFRCPNAQLLQYVTCLFHHNHVLDRLTDNLPIVLIND